MTSLEFELDKGGRASAHDFFLAGAEIIRALDGLADEPVNWTITDLRMGSALATVAGDDPHLEAADKAARGLMEGLDVLRRGERPEDWNPEVVLGMKAFARLVEPSTSGPRASLRLIQGEVPTQSVDLDRVLTDGLTAWQPVDRLFQGSTIGRIVGVNIARGNRASLRPKAGRVVQVRFGDELAADMKNALYNDVEVFGTLRRDDQDRVFHVAADDVNVLDVGTSASWDSIFGLDPNFTGGIPVERYLEESRGEA